MTLDRDCTRFVADLGARIGGETVVNAPYQPHGVPPSFEVEKPGEIHGITIDRGNWGGSGALHRPRAGKDGKPLEWRIEDAAGRVVLAGSDPYRRGTRLVRFTPQSIGEYTLTVEWDNSGFFKRFDTGHVTLLVARDDRSLLRRWLPGVW